MKRVLIVDDSRFSRLTNSKILKQLNYEVIGEAVDGLDGIEKLNSLKPDLIIADIEMPNLDGIAMLKRIRKEGNNVKVVVVSSIMNSQMLQEVIRLKASIVRKPIKEKNLLNAIKQISD